MFFFRGPPGERWRCGICEHKILKPGNMALHYEKEHINYKFSNPEENVIDKVIRNDLKSGNNSIPSHSNTLTPFKKPRNNSVFWPCSICGNTFSNYQRYQKHLKISHLITEQQVAVDMEVLKNASSVLNEYNQTKQQ